MDLVVKKQIKKGKFLLPSAKAIVHRILIKHFLIGKATKLNIKNFGTDILATLSFLKSLNACVFIKKNFVFLSFRKIFLKKPLCVLESASTFRFFFPFLVEKFKSFHVKMHPNLRERLLKVGFPYDNLEVTKTKEGLYFDAKNAKKVQKLLLTSQFDSGFLFLNFYKKEKIVSENPNPYVKMTEKILLMEDVKLEPCFSQLGLYLPGIINKNVGVKIYENQHLQGDEKVFTFFETIGGKIINKKDTYYFYLEKVNDFFLDLTYHPDLVMPFSYFIYKYKKGKIKYPESLVFKESNRIKSTINLYKGFGALLNFTDGIVSFEKTCIPSFVVDSNSDHRVAILALFVSDNPEVVIKNFEVSKKSDQEVLNVFKKLGGKVVVRKNKICR